MAQWLGTARSNYFTVVDMEGLIKSLASTAVEISPYASNTKFCLVVGGDSDDGGWPSTMQDEDDEDIDFDMAIHVMPFVAEHEVVVTMEAGAERSCYITGYAHAYIRRGEEVTETSLALCDIYSQAALALGVNQIEITECAY